MLFCGTFRSNLDPFNEHSDAEVWEALRKAHLDDTVTKFEDRLNHEITESGGNLRLIF